MLLLSIKCITSPAQQPEQSACLLLCLFLPFVHKKDLINSTCEVEVNLFPLICNYPPFTFHKNLLLVGLLLVSLFSNNNRQRNGKIAQSHP